MKNKEIIRLLKLTTQLLVLHDESDRKIKSFEQVIFNLERVEQPLAELNEQELSNIRGIGSQFAGNIHGIVQNNNFDLLNELIELTPAGVMELIRVKGIGTKKVKALWKELGIESLEELRDACIEGKVATLKGFGNKTQQQIQQLAEFKLSTRSFVHLPTAINVAQELMEHLEKLLPQDRMALVGKLRRKWEVIDQIDVVIGTDNRKRSIQAISELPTITLDQTKCGPWICAGKFNNINLNVKIRLCPTDEFAKIQFMYSGDFLHYSAIKNASGESLSKWIVRHQPRSESEAYERFDWPLVPAELREGYVQQNLSKIIENKSEIIDHQDIKGILHAHSTYSDGKHSLEKMARACIDLGYQYLGITDHSKSAFYANGLFEAQIFKQHQEIDELNKKLSPFKIFKGIESDILNDGNLDYEDDVLAKFDFIITSVHSNLKMDIDKATQRILTAIANPYTTIMGHVTGRLLLEREGYPLHHHAIIDACAKYNVVLELNANPWRLDVDWRWVPYALEKGVKLSINPDAHEIDGISDVQYGVFMGKKGGLTVNQTLNCLDVEKIEAFFQQRKEKNNLPIEN